MPVTEAKQKCICHVGRTRDRQGRTGKIRAYICVCSFEVCLCTGTCSAHRKTYTRETEEFGRLGMECTSLQPLCPSKKVFQENVSQTRSSRMSSECMKKVFFFSPPQDNTSTFLGQRVTIPSLVLCACLFFFFFLKYNSAHLLATTLGTRGIWLLFLL